MKRSKRREIILPYLEKFFLNFILYKDWPVKAKIASKYWGLDMYEQLSENQKDELCEKLKKDSE